MFRPQWFLIALTFGSLSISLPVDLQARVWHVLVDGSGDAPTIAAAMDSAQAGDEVVVGPGVYTESAVIMLKANVDLRGENGREATFLEGGTHRILRGNNVGHIDIQGLTLQNTNIEQGSAGYSGAGAWFTGDSNPSFIDCTFDNIRVAYIDEAKGAAVFADQATFTRVRFSNNILWAKDAIGGAAYTGAASFTDCEFESNSASDGNSNQTASHGGAVRSVSGTYIGCSFVSNHTYGMMPPQGSLLGGGAIADFGHLSITDCDFRDNRALADYDAGKGGAIFATTVTVTNSIFRENLAASAYGGPGAGGGVYADTAYVTNSVFLANEARMTNPSSDAPGGGLYVKAWGEIENCTLIDNMACCPWDTPYNYTSAGGAHVQDGWVRNTLVVDTDIGLVCTGNAAWSCSALFNNTHGNDPCEPEGAHFTDDPLFCAANFLGTDDFSLHSDSPYIDAPGCGLIGAVGSGCGPTPVQSTPWSEVKRRFR